MGTASVQVANFIHLELQPVNNPRLLGLTLFLNNSLVLLFVGSLEFLGTGITHNKYELAAIR